MIDGDTLTQHTDLPWTWHAKSSDQAHNGSIFHLKRPGHAYAIAMQPQYVEDKQFNADAAFIVRACNSHDALVKALKPFAELADICDHFNHPDDKRVCKATIDGVPHVAATAGDCRKARAALTAAGAPHER